MRSEDREEFARILNGMALMKPGANRLEHEAISLWWNSMRDWTIEEFTKAAEHLMRSVEFMPSPFHFEKLKHAGETTPDEAWTIALTECKHWRNPESLPGGRIARAVASVGGWQAIAHANLETAIPHIERRFKAAFAELSDVETIREALPSIAVQSKTALRGPSSIGDISQVLKLEKRAQS